MTVNASYSRRAAYLAESLAMTIGRREIAARANIIAGRARQAGKLAQRSDPLSVSRFLWLVSYRNELLRLARS